MTRGDTVSISALGVLLVSGFMAWVLLGGLDASGRWNVPNEALSFLDWLVKGVTGSLLTVLTRLGPNNRPPNQVVIPAPASGNG